jgi:hypothetical protein
MLLKFILIKIRHIKLNVKKLQKTIIFISEYVNYRN